MSPPPVPSAAATRARPGPPRTGLEWHSDNRRASDPASRDRRAPRRSPDRGLRRLRASGPTPPRTRPASPTRRPARRGRPAAAGDGLERQEWRHCATKSVRRVVPHGAQARVQPQPLPPPRLRRKNPRRASRASGRSQPVSGVLRDCLGHNGEARAGGEREGRAKGGSEGEGSAKVASPRATSLPRPTWT